MMIISIVGAIATYAAVKAVEDAADRGIRNKIAEKKSAKEEAAAPAAAVPAPATAPAPVPATPQWVAGQPAMFFQGAGALRPGTIATISDQGVVTLVVKSDGGGYESITGPAGNLMAVPA